MREAKVSQNGTRFDYTDTLDDTMSLTVYSTGETVIKVGCDTCLLTNQAARQLAEMLKRRFKL